MSIWRRQNGHYHFSTCNFWDKWFQLWEPSWPLEGDSVQSNTVLPRLERPRIIKQMRFPLVVLIEDADYRRKYHTTAYYYTIPIKDCCTILDNRGEPGKKTKDFQKKHWKKHYPMIRLFNYKLNSLHETEFDSQTAYQVFQIFIKLYKINRETATRYFIVTL